MSPFLNLISFAFLRRVPLGHGDWNSIERLLRRFIERLLRRFLPYEYEYEYGMGFHGLHGHGHLEVHKGSWFQSRNRGGDGDGCAPSLRRLSTLRQTLSLCVPVQLCIVEGAPGHNRRGVAETPLPAKSQGRTEDYTF